MQSGHRSHSRTRTVTHSPPTGNGLRATSDTHSLPHQNLPMAAVAARTPTQAFERTQRNHAAAVSTSTRPTAKICRGLGRETAATCLAAMCAAFHCSFPIAATAAPLLVTLGLPSRRLRRLLDRVRRRRTRWLLLVLLLVRLNDIHIAKFFKNVREEKDVKTVRGLDWILPRRKGRDFHFLDEAFDFHTIRSKRCSIANRSPRHMKTHEHRGIEKPAVALCEIRRHASITSALGNILDQVGCTQPARVRRDRYHSVPTPYAVHCPQIYIYIHNLVMGNMKHNFNHIISSQTNITSNQYFLIACVIYV